MPYLTVADREEIGVLDHIGKDRSITMTYETWELHEYSLVPASSKQLWTVETSNQLEKPCFVIIGFQTSKSGVNTANVSKFDHGHIRYVKHFLNSQYYHYGSLNINVGGIQYSVLYIMHANFQSGYYGKTPEPLLVKRYFMHHVPLIVIDCLKQNESLKSAAVEMRLEVEAELNFLPATWAYYLILHDQMVQYNPMSGNVKKLV